MRLSSLKLRWLRAGYTTAGIALLSTAVLSGCATGTIKSHDADAATITRTGSRITYKGVITPEAVQRFEALLTPEVDELEITSPGGIILAGIAFGELVHAANLDVTVPLYCSSACAQHVFPAGRRKRVADGALLGWHGNVAATVAEVWPIARARLKDSPEVAVQAQTFVAELGILADRESAFYHRLSLSTDAVAQLTQLSRKHGWRLWVGPPAKDWAFDYQSASVALTRTALEELGVSGIERYWYPTSREELEKVLRENPLAKALAFPDYAVRPRFCTAFAPAPAGSLVDICIDAETSRLPPRPTSAATE